MKLKNTISVTSLLIITLFIISNENVYSQCESGFTSKIVTVPYNGCNYKVEVCYRCDVSAPGPVIMTNEYFQASTGSCPPPHDWDDVIPYIREYISSAQFVFGEICTWFNPVSCTTHVSNWSFVTFNFAFCFEEYDESDKVKPCLEYFGNHCEVTYRYCKNASGQITRYLDHQTDVHLFGEVPNCPEFGQHGDGCFIVNTPCNP